MRWGMAIELKRCIACNSCAIACKAEHFVPPGIFWGRVLIGEQGKYPAVTKLKYSVRCNQCGDPKCVEVCPTGATQQREDGIVWIDETKRGLPLLHGCLSLPDVVDLRRRGRRVFPGSGFYRA